MKYMVVNHVQDEDFRAEIDELVAGKKKLAVKNLSLQNEVRILPPRQLRQSVSELRSQVGFSSKVP